MLSALPARARPLLLGAGLAGAGYLVLWVTVALAHERDPLLLRARDAYPFASGLALFAAAGLLLGSLAERGYARPVVGAVAGAAVGYALATLHVLYPYALPILVPAVSVLAGGAAVGGVAGLLAELPRRRRAATPRAPGGAAAPRRR